MARTGQRGSKKATGDGALAALHAGGKRVFARATRAEIARLAAEWSYTLRQRSRWAHDNDLRTVIGEYAVDTLGKLQVSEQEVRELARASRIEVELFDPAPGVNGATSRAASEFPWEYVLSAATRERGRAQPVLITRLLRRAGRRRTTSQAKAQLTIITSAPGRIGDIYEFDSEVNRLAHAVGESTGATLAFPSMDEPPRFTLAELQAHMRTKDRTRRGGAPQFVHVSGVDPNQATELVPGIFDELPEAPGEGLLLSGVTAREEVADAVTLAEALVPEASPPALVTLNLHYSAAHTAREMLRQGAGASLGFMDAIPDEIAEYFFTVFYAECHAERSIAGIPHAFQRAWGQLADQGHDLHGTGVVLWLSDPVTDGEGASTPAATKEAPSKEIEASRGKRMADVLAVDVDVPSEINYSLLHNQRSAISVLTLSKLVSHKLDDVRVEVELDAGDVKQVFRQSYIVDEPHFALAEQVKLPLTAPLLRSLRERLHTTIYTRVTWEGRVAHEDTRHVALLPVDEWYDDTRNNPWLPSFVLPRDPAVARIISEARKYLVALTDDPNAGFDGYQQVEDVDSDPASAEVTDLQVQAIWTALVNDRDLLYINPPPAYSKGGQRLRTPSEVLQTSSGTCIDLSLLLAACLEYVDIHACLVLLTGHCFVGYWRAEDYQSAFMTVSRFPEGRVPPVAETARRSPIGLVDRYGWRLGPQCFDEIHEHLRTDELRMLEATGLCFNYSFAQAIEEGGQNMNDRNTFDSLLDIRVARRSSPPVTPLPILPDGR